MNKEGSKKVYFFAALLWGSSYAIQKPLLEHINPVTFTFWNFLLSAALFLPYVYHQKISLFYRWREGLVLGLFVSGMEILEMVGLKLTSSANTVFLTNLGMLLVPYVGFLLFRHRIKRVDNVAIMIAIVGMYLLVGGIDRFGLGEGIVLLSALSSAVYFIYSERFEREKNTHITTLCLQQFVVIMGLCLVWKFFDPTISLRVESTYWWPLLWQTILFTAIPYAIIQWASRWADEMVAALYDGVVEPLTGAVFAWVIFQEATTPVHIFGGMLMISSFVLATLVTKKHFLYTATKKFFAR